VELGMAHLVSRTDSKSSKSGLHFALWAGLALAVVVAWLLAEVSLP
jgi:high-affinity Fe2+/Pb2+ permease